MHAGDQYTSFNGGATGRCGGPTPPNPGPAYYMPDVSYDHYAYNPIGTYPLGTAIYDCMQHCLDLYDSWGCRYISVTKTNNLQYWYVLLV